MARKQEKATFRVKKNPPVGVCRIIKNGKACSATATKRGLCNTHFGYLYKNSMLEEYAAPNVRDLSDVSKFRINKNPAPGKCRIKNDREACLNATDRRGLCSNHYQKIYKLKLINKFGLPLGTKETKIRLKKNLKKGQCRIIEEDVPCPREHYGHGLCLKHGRGVNTKHLKLPKAKR